MMVRSELDGEYHFDASNPPSLGAQLKDAFSDAMISWQLARYQVRRRYASTGLGPYWILISNSVIVGALTFIFPHPMGVDIAFYFTWVSLGYVTWLLINDAVTTGGNAFVTHRTTIQQRRTNLFGLIIQDAATRALVFAHNWPLLIAVVLVGQSLSIVWLAAIPGVIFLLANTAMAAYSISAISASYRDLPQIMRSVTRLMFFVTPIIWVYEPGKTTGTRALLVQSNPIYYFIDIVRSPLAFNKVPLESWGVVLALSVINFAALVVVHKHMHRTVVWRVG